MKITWNNRVPEGNGRKPIVFVSSTVYDKKDMLDYIRIQLAAKQYDVRMSHAGTVPADSDESAFQNCLDGVADADFFIGIISPSYGSGIMKSGLSITHEEMRRARDLNKPRLLLVDERVKTAADFLNHLGFKGPEGRALFEKLVRENSPLSKDRDPIKNVAKICDMRSIGLYDEMLLGAGAGAGTRAEDRRGNWIQEFRNIEEFKRYISTQFTYLQVMESFEGLPEAASLIDRHLPSDIYKGGRA